MGDISTKNYGGYVAYLRNRSVYCLNENSISSINLKNGNIKISSKRETASKVSQTFTLTLRERFSKIDLEHLWMFRGCKHWETIPYKVSQILFTWPAEREKEISN